MGEAKRRKLMDSSYGKLKLPTEVPTDYLEHKGFKPCFGYQYVVNFGDVEPCTFYLVSAEGIMFSEKDNKVVAISFSLYLSDYDKRSVITVEIPNKDLQRKVKRVVESFLEEEEETIRFTAYPDYRDRYKDQKGLSVIPFKLIDCEKCKVGEKPIDNAKRIFMYYNPLEPVTVLTK